MSLLQYDLVGQTLSSEIFKSNTGNTMHSVPRHPNPSSENDTVTVIDALKNVIAKFCCELMNLSVDLEISAFKLGV